MPPPFAAYETQHTVVEDTWGIASAGSIIEDGSTNGFTPPDTAAFLASASTLVLGEGWASADVTDVCKGAFTVDRTGDYRVTIHGTLIKGRLLSLSSPDVPYFGKDLTDWYVRLASQVAYNGDRLSGSTGDLRVFEYLDYERPSYTVDETLIDTIAVAGEKVVPPIGEIAYIATLDTGFANEWDNEPFTLHCEASLAAGHVYQWNLNSTITVLTDSNGIGMVGSRADMWYQINSVALEQLNQADAVAVDVTPSSTSVSPGDSINISGTALLDYMDEGYCVPIADGLATVEFGGSEWTAPVTDGTYSISIPVASDATSGQLMVTALDYDTGLSSSDSVSITVNTSNAPICVVGSSMPGQIDLSLAPGQGKWFDIPVQNMSLSPITVHFSVSGSADDWVTPQSDSFTLSTQQTESHRLSINVPDGTSTGTYNLNATYEGVTLPFSIQVTSTNEPFTEDLTKGYTYVDGDWSVINDHFARSGYDYFDISGKYQTHAQAYASLSQDQVDRTSSCTIGIVAQNVGAYNGQDLVVLLNNHEIGRVSEDDVAHGVIISKLFSNISTEYLTDDTNVLSFKLSQSTSSDTTVRWRAYDDASFSRRQTDDAFADEVDIPGNVMNAIDDGYMDYARLYAHVDSVSSEGRVYLFNNGDCTGSKKIDSGDQGRDIYWSLSKSELDDDNYFVLQGDDDTEPRVRLSNIYLKIALNNNDPVLEIEKQVSQIAASVGDQFTVTVNVLNTRESSATGYDTDLDDADLTSGLTLVSGQLDKNNIGSLEYDESESNTYTVRADQPGRYVLGGARVLYENIDGEDFIDTSSPVYLEVTAGPLTVGSTAVLAESGGLARINFDAQVTFGGSTITDASVLGVVERNVDGTWMELGSLLLGWSTTTQAYVGVSEVLPDDGTYRAYVVAEKDLYEPGMSAPQEFEYVPREILAILGAASVDEGEQCTLNLSLSVQPVENVEVLLTDALSGADLQIEPQILVFTPDNWDSVQAVTITALIDDNGIDEMATVHVTGWGMPLKSLSLMVNDTAVPAMLESITISGSSEVNENSTASYTCTAHYDDSSITDVTALAFWEAFCGDGSEVLDGLDQGVLTLGEVVSDEDIVLSVLYEGKQAEISVQVKNQVQLTSIAIDGPTMVSGQSGADYVLWAYYDDGSTEEVTSFATWSENSDFASIDADGRMTTSPVGLDQPLIVMVSYGGLSDTHEVMITVLPPTRTVALDARGIWQGLDADGELVTVTLKGGGTGTILLAADGDSDPLEVTLQDTTAKSSLTISTKGGGASTTVGDIVVHGSLSKLTAKTTDLLGDIMIAGSIGTLIIDDVLGPDDGVEGGHVISVGEWSDAKSVAKMYFDEVAELSIESAMPIKTLKATEWLDDRWIANEVDGVGDICAPWIGEFAVKRDLYVVQMHLDSANAKGLSLASLRLGGAGGIIIDAAEGIGSIVGNEIECIISAEWMNSVKTRYDSKDEWEGGFYGEVSLTGANAKGLSLGTLSIGGDLDADIQLAAGGGAIKAADWINGSLQAKSVGSIAIKGDNDWFTGSLCADIVITGVDFKTGLSIKSLKADDLDINLTAPGGIGKIVTYDCWSTSTLSAGWIGSLSVKANKTWGTSGDFGANLTLTDENARRSLSSFKISGQITGGTWDLAAPVGTISAKNGMASDWNFTATGEVKKLDGGKGELGGVITGGYFGTIRTSGPLSADIEAKNVDSHGVSIKTLAASAVGDVSVEAEGLIKSIKATDWDGGNITAGSIKTLSVKGDFTGDIEAATAKTISIKGDLDSSNIELSADPGGEKMNPNALNLKVKGWIHDSSVLARGDIKSISASGVDDGTFVAGIPTMDAEPVDNTIDLLDQGRLGSVKVSGKLTRDIDGVDYSVIGAVIGGGLLGKVSFLGTTVLEGDDRLELGATNLEDILMKIKLRDPLDNKVKRLDQIWGFGAAEPLVIEVV